MNNYGIKEIKNLENFPNLKSLDLSCNRIKKIENLCHLKVSNLLGFAALKLNQNLFRAYLNSNFTQIKLK